MLQCAPVRKDNDLEIVSRCLPSTEDLRTLLRVLEQVPRRGTVFDTKGQAYETVKWIVDSEPAILARFARCFEDPYRRDALLRVVLPLLIEELEAR